MESVPTPFLLSQQTRLPYFTRLRHALEDLSIWFIKWALGVLLILAITGWFVIDYAQTRAMTREVVREIGSGGLLQILIKQQQESAQQQTRSSPAPASPAGTNEKVAR